MNDTVTIDFRAICVKMILNFKSGCVALRWFMRFSEFEIFYRISLMIGSTL